MQLEEQWNTRFLVDAWLNAKCYHMHLTWNYSIYNDCVSTVALIEWHAEQGRPETVLRPKQASILTALYGNQEKAVSAPLEGCAL